VRWRLVAVFVGITLVVLAAHDIPLAAHLQRVERDAIITELERDAFTIAGRAEESLENGDALRNPSLQAMVDRYTFDHPGARVIITDTDGVAMVVSDEEARAGTSYASRPEIETALSGAPVSGTRYSTTLATELLYVAVPVLSGSDVEGAVRITFPAAVVDERVERRMGGLLVVALISLVTAAIAAIVMAGTVTRPLRRLRAATDRAAQGDLTVRAPDDEGPPEVRSLAAAFNTMSERISGLLAQQRAFTGDASHQLRTPLTALRLRLEQAADIAERDPVEARVRIEAASAEVERMQRLVEGLLALARAEGRREELVVVDAASIARERAEIWESLAEESDVSLSVDVPATALVMVVPGALEQIVDNYIDNALSVSPAGTTISVAVVAGIDTVTISVLDRGPGMTDEQRERAFDRFWRAPTSAAGGSGLGLAIVQQLALACGGSVSIDARPGGGASATVRLTPATRSSATS
jgi:signal transduction histidine kinase